MEAGIDSYFGRHLLFDIIGIWDKIPQCIDQCIISPIQECKEDNPKVSFFRRYGGYSYCSSIIDGEIEQTCTSRQ